MQHQKSLLARFFSGIGASALLTPLPYESFPFAFPEKALTFDWDNIGTDMSAAIKKYEGSDERK